ncbi:uncharacterized protein LOC114515612 [Dendronephthya gigantea]|uniref:uncharacterized protein LOC114515612 n=1 Tax=Dendronephthya gigantea TaxID=151771 RepID=UPI00106D2796|nr:uncharacterized protein LOC114515612 [Dendronephthya gigantea]
MPLNDYIPCMNVDRRHGRDETELITSYFQQGFTNHEILEFLKLHGIEFSLSTLKRRLRILGLRRRVPAEEQLTQEEIECIVEIELAGSKCNVGYRKMWKHISTKYGITVRRDVIRKCLVKLDPQGVQSRAKKRLRRRAYSSRGPNHIWHIDGHDKLKPFGFNIHGCIDGFSRRLIWLEVGPTNKNPQVIGKYYLDAVLQIGGVPQRMRSDDGTENSIVEALQIFLRSQHHDEHAGLASFSIGTSTSNQRIEAYWSHLIRDGPGWWINFFKDLRDFDLFNDSDPVQMDLIRFCFMDILRNELHKVAEMWNQHIIAPSKFGNNTGPRGRPDVMFFLPHLFDTGDCKQEIDRDEVNEFYDYSMSVKDFSDEFGEFASFVMTELGLTKPTNAKEAFHLYLTLLQKIETIN